MLLDVKVYHQFSFTITGAYFDRSEKPRLAGYTVISMYMGTSLMKMHPDLMFGSGWK